MATWTTSNSALTMTLTVTEDSTNVSNNTSTVSWSLKLTADATWFTSRQIYWSVNIGGITKSATSTATASTGQTITLGSGSGTITHNADGSKTISCTAHAERSGTWSTSWSDLDISESMALTNIPRYSQVACTPTAVDINGTNYFTIAWDIKNAAYYYVLTVSIPGVTEITRWTIHGNVGRYAKTWAPSPTLISYFAENSKELRIAFNLITYKSSTMTEANRLGTTAVAAYLRSVESIHAPEISNVSMTEENDDLVSYEVTDSTLVKMMSEKQISCDITLHSTSIQQAQVTCGNAVSALEASGGSYTATLHEPDGDHIYIDVLDERGYSKRYEVPCTVIDYNYPAIIAAEVERVTPTGGAVTGKIKGRIYGGYVGNQENGLYLSYQWKENAEDAPVTIVTQVSGGEISEEGYAEFTWSGTLLTSFDYRKAYLIRFTLADEYGASMVTSDWLAVYEGVPVFSWGKDHFDVYGELHVHDREDPENVYTVIKPEEMTVKIYNGNFETDTLSGNTDTTITLPVPNDAVEILAVIPFGVTPALYHETEGRVNAYNVAQHTIGLRTVGSNSQKYTIRYTVFYR